MEAMPALRRTEGASGSQRASDAERSVSQRSGRERGSARGVSGAIDKRGTFSGDRGRSGVGKSYLSISL